MAYLQTTDIVLAATLKVKGYTLDQIEKDGKRGVFCFKEVPDTELEDFDLGKTLVEPVALNNAVKALTTAIKRIL